MITNERFHDIDTEIKNSIIQTLQSIKSTSLSDYILLLADGEYREEMLLNTSLNLSPYLIDYTMDRYKDVTRLTFLADFLNTFYSFSSDKLPLDDNEQRLHIELMIYTHIWESKPFLKKLYRLSHIANGEAYEWQVVLPDMSKHDFIRNDIRKTFEKSNNHISQIIKNGFHTSLRNAFAHSEYYFDKANKETTIYLDNYKGNDWELREISLTDWCQRFVYSALLSYHFINSISLCRKKLITDFGTNIFTIKHPSEDGSIIRDINIEYNETQNIFRFQGQ
jgi:hypothetical protein